MERLLPLCKRIAALLLLASLFLPLARCPYDTTEPAPGTGSDITVTHHSDRVPWREVDGSGGGLLILAAFTWPLLVQIGALLAPPRFRTRLVLVVEFLLCPLTAGTLFGMMIFTTTTRYGFWIATGGLLLYFGCLCGQFWRATFGAPGRRRRRGVSPTGGGP